MKNLLLLRLGKRRIFSVSKLSILLGCFIIIGTAAEFWASYQQISDTKYYQQPIDRHRYIAAMFATAVYVKDWDDDPALFFTLPRTGRGDFLLRHPGWESSKALSKIAIDYKWQLYFNQFDTTANGIKKDTQILTGSRMVNGKPVFVIAFRGSDKFDDYLYTNLKNQATPLLTDTDESAGLSNPITTHCGFTEQARLGFQALTFDPLLDRVITVEQAMSTYPEAEVIITGHSAGGGTAHVFYILAQAMKLNVNCRIHTRTFAPAGAFMSAQSIADYPLDCINYFIPGDFIFLANYLSGYNTIGANVLLPPSTRFGNYSRELHEMTTYVDQIRESDKLSMEIAAREHTFTNNNI